MHKNRSVVFVIRNKKILMEKLNYPSEGKDDFYSIPGGGIEDGETPEQAAIRELKKNAASMAQSYESSQNHTITTELNIALK